MQHEKVNCRFRSEDQHWICLTCGKDAGKKFPKPHDSPDGKESIPQCDGVQVTLSTPSFVHRYTLKEKTNVLLHLDHLWMQTHTYRFSSSIPIIWEHVRRDLSVRPITDPGKVAELNVVLSTLRMEIRTREEVSKRKGTIPAKKKAASA